MKIKWNVGAFAQLRQAHLPLVEEAAESIAEACNAESSWGGYDSAASNDGYTATGRVWEFDNREDEARNNRLIRNLDAGR